MPELEEAEANSGEKMPGFDRSQADGVLFGKYELGKLLGCGAFAKVYHARNIKSGQSVAIKVLNKQQIVKGGLITHIKREISIMRRLRHPHIVKLFEVLATKSKIYFVMEFVKGGELFAKVAKGRLKEDLCRKYFQQLISAVGFCHSRGVYHRDLKPENLLLDENGDLKVSDFGLSALSDQRHNDGLFHTLCGTPAYVAPEILAKKGYSGEKVDIWSCGVILFVLNAGYLPFNDSNLMVMYRKIYKGDFRCPRWTSPELRRFLSRLLDTNPETRITIAEIKQDPWFRRGFREVKPYFDDDFAFSKFEVPDPGGDDRNPAKCPPPGLPRPASLNAFDIISFSSGFDLSNLFDDSGRPEPEQRFITEEPASKIIEKLEEIAKLVSFTVSRKDCKVDLQGKEEGQNGHLAVGAEIFRLTENLNLVEVKKRGGDGRAYEEFYKRKLRPALRNIVYDSHAPVSDTD